MRGLIPAINEYAVDTNKTQIVALFCIAYVPRTGSMGYCGYGEGFMQGTGWLNLIEEA